LKVFEVNITITAIILSNNRDKYRDKYFEMFLRQSSIVNGYIRLLTIISSDALLKRCITEAKV